MPTPGMLSQADVDRLEEALRLFRPERRAKVTIQRAGSKAMEGFRVANHACARAASVGTRK